MPYLLWVTRDVVCHQGQKHHIGAIEPPCEIVTQQLDRGVRQAGKKDASNHGDSTTSNGGQRHAISFSVNDDGQ